MSGSRERYIKLPKPVSKRGKDIIIDYNDFEVEVKYWRNWAAGKSSRTKGKWSANFESAMIWLCDEIKNGKKGKRAFIAGWCTVFGWNGLLQLGSTTGKNPDVNKERIHMFRFFQVMMESYKPLRLYMI